MAATTLTPMTRREFVEQIAFDYATFEREYAGRQIVPLDRRFAFSTGRRYIEHGRYAPRRDYRYLDWGRVAREARKALPRTRRLLAEFG
jgi:hypothetical protein